MKKLPGPERGHSLKPTRRAFLKRAGAALAVAALPSPSWMRPQAPVRGAASKTFPLTHDWLFGGRATDGSAQPQFDDSTFEQVTLPHCVADLSYWDWDPESWADVWIYRRHFDGSRLPSAARVFLDFEGVMIGATPTLNGKQLGRHLGGYLPFSYEITDLIEDGGNVLAVELDARTLDVPPNQPGVPEAIDYLQPGGLYRSVSLRVVPETFVSDVFARPVDVLSDRDRRLEVECHLNSTADAESPLLVDAEVCSGDRSLARATREVSSSDEAVKLTIGGLEAVNLWDVNDPNLYDVRVRLYEKSAKKRGRRGERGCSPLHEYHTRTGFREARFEKDGFYLNGRRLQIFGLNRHEHFPYVGYAMPERVQRRDAELLKEEFNCNMVRCSHYPQSQHFLDACDELGLLVWEEPPTWLPLGDEDWQDLFVRDVEEMVRRDRNRPSVIMWAVEINHAFSGSLDLYARTRRAAKSLDDTRPTTAAHGGRPNVEYAPEEYLQDVWGQNDYSKNPDETILSPVGDLPYLITETVGSAFQPPLYRRTLRKQEQSPQAFLDAQQQQAVLHAQMHHAAGACERYSGVLAWSAFDYGSVFRGQIGSGKIYRNMKWNGVADIFRIPKRGAGIYRSQVDPEEKVVLEPAFYWIFDEELPGPGEGAMVCSNCERLELYIDGQQVAQAEPDREDFDNLDYPPFFADLTVQNGAERLPELRIDGFVGERKAISRSFSANTERDQLRVEADDDVLEADGIDATRIVLRAVDEYGNQRLFVTGEVELEVEGPGEIVGSNPFSFTDTGGAGAVWLKTTQGGVGTVTVHAAHADLGTRAAAVSVRE